MTPKDINTRNSDSVSDMLGLQELPQEIKSSDDNSNADMPSLVPTARSRSNSSGKKDSGDDSEPGEWNPRHGHRKSWQQSPQEISLVSSRDFDDSNSDEYLVDSGCKDKIPELAERYNVDWTTWEEPDRGPDQKQSQNQTQQRTSKPNSQMDPPVAYNKMPNFGITYTS